MIDDARYRDTNLSIPELQAEVQELLAEDLRHPEGRARVAEAMLRRHPDIPQNVAVQVAVLEGESVRRETMLNIISWILGGQLYFRLLQRFASRPTEE